MVVRTQQAAAAIASNPESRPTYQPKGEEKPENVKNKEKDPEEEIQCQQCGEIVRRKNLQAHKQTPTHQNFRYCHVCEAKFPKDSWKEHRKSPEHSSNILKKDEEMKNEQITCKACGEVYIRKNMEEHESTPKHIEAQRRKAGETICRDCKESYVKGCWNHHKKTEKHIKFSRQKKEKKDQIHVKPELYTLRENSEENQQYINTLITLIVLRLGLNTDKDFLISRNNNQWGVFGDIVIERSSKVEIVENGKKKVEDRLFIEAMQCRKIESRNKYDVVALKESKGHLSLKEQHEIMEKLMENNSSFKNTYFKLFTVSNLEVNQNQKIFYDSEEVSFWKNEDKEIWENKEILIRQSRGRDLFNITDDTDNVYEFELSTEEGKDKQLRENLSRFRLYVRQHRRSDLKNAITTLIEDEFGFDLNISDNLIKYVRKKFKTDKKLLKKKERTVKVSRTDFFFKMAELFLVPFLMLPDRIQNEKDLDLWYRTILEFDVVLMKPSDDIVDKIYRGINFLIRKQTSYVSDTFRVNIDSTKISDQDLRKKMFDFDGTLQSLYFIFWKMCLTPLVLKADDEKQLSTICSTARFLKEKNIPLKFIILTNLNPVQDYLTEDLILFQSFADLRRLDERHLNEILEQKIPFLNFKVTFKEILDQNDDFLEKLSPEVLMNLSFDDYLFIEDAHISMTQHILDDTIVLEDEYIEKMDNYFKERGTSEEKCLSYIVSVKGRPHRIRVPPTL